MLLDEELIIDHSTENKPVEGHGLGRLPAFDSRDKRHLMTPPPATEIDIRKKHWKIGSVLDQGAKPHCVAFTMEQMLASSPVRNRFYKTPQELYTIIQRADEWEGESPDYEGTSVRAGFKVLRDAGFFESWQNAFELDLVVRHLLTTSPVGFGTSWTNSMFYPFLHKGESFIKYDPSSGNVGGHAYLAVGCNLDKDCPDGSKGAIRFVNSWSRQWADGGKCWISFKDMSLLIADFGEAITSKELKFTPEN